MKSNKIGWHIVLLLLSVVVCCFGCDSGGGGGSSKNESSVGVDWQENAVSVQGQIHLPALSPLSMSEINVDLFETSTSPAKNGEVQLKAPDGQIAEAYIMLPAESDDALPVIYLYTVILPGETDIDFSIEETAVSLLMSRISQEYLLNAGTPKQVKQIIRDNGANFINEVSATLESDPYALRTDNLDNIYTPAFETAADACRSALMFEASGSESLMLMAAASASSSNGSQLYVRPQQEQHDFIVYEDTTGLLGLDNWTDLADVGGTMTGQLKIENDTMLFAHYRIHELLTGSEMTSLQPGSGITGMIGMAFHPDILGPQKGWMRLWWAGTAKKDVDFKSTKVTVFTPASAFDDTASEIEKQIGGGLAFRTGATTLMTVISSFVPIGEDGWEHWFLEMHDRGLLTATYDKFAYGDIMGGIEVLFWTFCDGKLMQSFLKDYIVKYLEKELDAKKVTSQFMNKFNSAVKKIPITKIGLAVDLIKLVDDCNLTPARIVFDRAEFPLNLSDAAPNPVTKVGPDDPLPRITITGMGLGDLYFDGEIHSPQVYLEAENTKGKEKLLNIDKENIFAADEYLYFDLPREWAEIGSDIVGPIYLNVVHSFVCEHGEDELVRLELPHEDHEALFALGFESDVMITAVTEPKPTLGEEITIIGQGFSPVSSDNGVYFNDHTGASVAAEVLLATSTTLDVIVPNSLDFGPLTVEVELHDGSVSNEFPLSLHPKPVFADTEDGTHFDDTLEVAFMQEEDCDIYYSINSGGIKEYAGGTVEINETSHVYPFARVTVDGLNYDSAIGDFFYYKCTATQTLVDGVCTNEIAPPSASPIAQEFSGSIVVTLAQAEGLDIYYIINDGDWTFYDGPISITESATFLAKAVTNSEDESETVSFTYVKTAQSNSGKWVLGYVTHTDGCADKSSVSYSFSEGSWQMQIPHAYDKITSGSGTYNIPPSTLTPGQTVQMTATVNSAGPNSQYYYTEISTWYGNGPSTTINQGETIFSLPGGGGETVARAGDSENKGSFVDVGNFVVPDSNSCNYRDNSCNRIIIHCSGGFGLGCSMVYRYVYGWE